MKKGITNEQILELYDEGYSICLMAEILGCSKQNICGRLNFLGLPTDRSRVKKRKVNKTEFFSVYPNLKEYIIKNYFNMKNFSNSIGVNHDTIMFVLKGNEIKKSTIDKILNATGLTYEYAFYQERSKQ